MKRRAFLAHSGAAISGSWISLGLPAILAASQVSCKAKQEGAAFRVFTASEADEFEAMAAQVIPSGDLPGAREAGVIYFMDTVLAEDKTDGLEWLRNGLAELQADIRDTHGAESFAALDNTLQIQVLQGIEETDFFATIRYLTIAGMFSNPSYGGNRDQLGWKLIGFEGPRGWSPPFGFYDADYAEKGE